MIPLLCSCVKSSISISGKDRQAFRKICPFSILKSKQKILKLNTPLEFVLFAQFLRMCNFSDISQTISVARGGLQSREPKRW